MWYSSHINNQVRDWFTKLLGGADAEDQVWMMKTPVVSQRAGIVPVLLGWSLFSAAMLNFRGGKG